VASAVPRLQPTPTTAPRNWLCHSNLLAGACHLRPRTSDTVTVCSRICVWDPSGNLVVDYHPCTRGIAVGHCHQRIRCRPSDLLSSSVHLIQTGGQVASEYLCSLRVGWSCATVECRVAVSPMQREGSCQSSRRGRKDTGSLGFHGTGAKRVLLWFCGPGSSNFLASHPDCTFAAKTRRKRVTERRRPKKEKRLVQPQAASNGGAA
jgi:hypothetical protein